MPPIAAAFLWKWFYTPDTTGLFNAVLQLLHLPSVQWLQSSHTLAVLCLVLFSTWINMGGTVLIYLASLQGIPATTRRPRSTARACCAGSEQYDDPQTPA